MQRRPVCLVCLLLMLCMCVLDRAGLPIVSGNPASDSLKEWIKENPRCTVYGRVQEYKASEDSFSACLSNVSLIVGSEQIPITNIRVYLKSDTVLKIGASAELSGMLYEIQSPRNPGEFDSAQYYACRHIYYVMNQASVHSVSKSYFRYGQLLSDIRNYLVRILEKSAKEEAGVFEAMLLGEKENLDSELKMRYQMAGVIHILAISGLHISVLGMGLFSFLKRLGAGNIFSGFTSLCIMLQYALLTGGSVSAMRAVCMFIIAIGAKLLGRSYDLLTALAFSAILLLMESPAYIKSSSFLLSFGAVAGLGFAAPVLYELCKPKRKISKSLISSLAVQLTTFPFMLSMYGEISIAGVLLNLIVLPSVSAVLLSGLCCALIGIFSYEAAFLAAVPGRILLMLYEKLCIFSAKLPFCIWIAGSPKNWQSVLYYLLILAGLASVYFLKIKKRQLKLLLFVICTLCAVGVLAYHPGRPLKITCLDVGQGDCAVIEIPGGKTVLIDCGSSSKNKIGQYQLMPFLKHEGIDYLDMIILSHTDEDHISGVLELLEFAGKDLTGIDVGLLLLPGLETKSTEYIELEELAVQAGTEVTSVNAGEGATLGEALFSFLSPSAGASGTDINEDSLVVELRYHEFKGLFTGDIGEETETELLSLLGDVDFLKVAHHGSKYSSCTAFLERICPEISVISCSAANTYGHPSPDTLNRLEASGSTVFCTKDSGAVTVAADGDAISVQQFVM